MPKASMDPALMASLAGQKRRQAKKALDSAVKEVQEQHQREAEHFATTERDLLAGRYVGHYNTFAAERESNNTPLAEYDKNLKTLEAMHKFDEADLEKKIEEDKTKHDAQAQSEINDLYQVYDLKFGPQPTATPTSSISLNIENTPSLHATTPGRVVDRKPTLPIPPNPSLQSTPRRNMFARLREDRQQSSASPLNSALGNGYYDDLFSQMDMANLTGNGDDEIYTNLPHTSIKSGTSTPRSAQALLSKEKRTPVTQTSKKTPRVSTPLSTPSTATSKYRDVGNAVGDSSPLSMMSTPSRTPTTTGIKTPAKRLRQKSTTPERTVEPARKVSRARADRAATRMAQKEEEMKKNLGDEHTGDNVSFGISFIGYNPTEDPEDKTLELTWRRATDIRLNDNAGVFEPHNGVSSCASEGRLLVLDQKWNGKAFFDSESGRFEIYQRSGERLRIQFREGQLEGFMTLFNCWFDGVALSIKDSPHLADDTDFETEGGASHPSHLA